MESVKMKILIVDDESIPLDILGKLLEAEGHEVQGCNTGPAALRELLDSKYDLLIADVHMPGMDGRDLTFAVRGMPSIKQMPVLLISGIFNEANFADVLKHSKTSFIEKPIHRKDLLEAIANLTGVDA
jgi:CheY-like chemotaxis protein